MAGLTISLATNGSVVGGTGSTAGNSDILSNFENVIGGSGADTITSSNANNRLTGGAGNDVLRGGAGTDPFVFNVGSNLDHIADFTAGNGGAHDFVDLSRAFGAEPCVLAFAEVQTHFGASVGHVTLTFNTDVIHFDNVLVANQAQLTAADFLFH